MTCAADGADAAAVLGAAPCPAATSTCESRDGADGTAVLAALIDTCCGAAELGTAEKLSELLSAGLRVRVVLFPPELVSGDDPPGRVRFTPAEPGRVAPAAVLLAGELLPAPADSPAPADGPE